MKKALSLLMQFVGFTILFALGSFHRPPFYQRVLEGTTEIVRIFVYDGLLLMLACYLLIVLLELSIRRFRPAALWTTAALALAALVGFGLKFGFITHELH